MSSPREKEKRDRRDSRGGGREGQGRKRKNEWKWRNKEIKTFHICPHLLKHSRPCLTVSQLSWMPRRCKIHKPLPYPSTPNKWYRANYKSFLFFNAGELKNPFRAISPARHPAFQWIFFFRKHGVTYSMINSYKSLKMFLIFLLQPSNMSGNFSSDLQSILKFQKELNDFSLPMGTCWIWVNFHFFAFYRIWNLMVFPGIDIFLYKVIWCMSGNPGLI